MPSLCPGCLKAVANDQRMKCTGCKVAYFCSKECQVKNWKSHETLCQQEKQVKANAAAQDSKREYRLWSQWQKKAPLSPLLIEHFGLPRLKEIQEKDRMIWLKNVAFDYNKQTFVPTCPPIEFPLEGYFEWQNQNGVSEEDISWLKSGAKKGMVVALQGATTTSTQFLSSLSLDTLPHGWILLQEPLSWEVAVEKWFPYHNTMLQSSIFDSWESLRKQNWQQQLDAIRQSPHFQPFLLNAFGMFTSQPLHETHFIKINIHLGLGLGQIENLESYQVLTMEEARQFLRDRRVGRHEFDNTVGLRFILSTKVMCCAYSSLSIPSAPGGQNDVPKCMSDAVAGRYFEKLSAISFPPVTSPDLH